MDYRVVTLAERPDLAARIEPLGETAWPEFMRRGGVVMGRYWPALFSTFSDSQILFVDSEDLVLAVGHTIPFVWDGTKQDLPSGIDQVLERGVCDYQEGWKPTALSALAAIVSGKHQRQGLSAEILRSMQRVAMGHGLRALVAPVRPSQKHLYPLIPIERYIQWRRSDGAPFDPWLRVHWRLGATFLNPAPESALVLGTVNQWEEWTHMAFPESGEYIIPGGLQPLTINREADEGRYYEPNIWMLHGLGDREVQSQQPT